MGPKVAVVVLACLLTVGALSGCLGGTPGSGKESDPELKRIKATPRGNPVPPGAYKFDGQFAEVLAPGPYQELPFEGSYLKSKLDGVDIEIGVWRPDVPEGTKVPIIAMASPYYGNLGEPMSKKSAYLLMLITNYVPHGYAVAGVSVRGTGDSGGCMDLMGKKEIGDLDQAITWLAERPWSNGNVGMTGLSYDGSTPWSVASTGNPHLKTIVPMSGVPDVYGLMFRNGSAEDRGPFLLNLLYYLFAVRVWVPGGVEVPVMALNRTAEGLVCPESWEGLGAALYSGVRGDRDPLGWWAERNRKPLVEKNYHGSILSVQGLQDWNVDPHMVIPWAQQLNDSGLAVHQMLGQWIHSFPDMYNTDDPSMRWDWAEILLNWFDYWLKGETTVDLGPAVQIQDSSGKWHYDDAFPPKDARWQTYFLASGNRLATEPGSEGSVLLVPADALAPLGTNARALPVYSADFSTGPLDGTTRISGLPRLHVSVTPHGATGHVAGYLYDVGPSGDEKLVGWTQINLNFADGTETYKSITPNEPIVAKMEFQPLDAQIQPGHRLLARVWVYEYADRLPAVPPEPVTLNYGGSTKSALELPIIQRDASAYFEPPMPTK